MAGESLVNVTFGWRSIYTFRAAAGAGRRCHSVSNAPVNLTFVFYIDSGGSALNSHKDYVLAWSLDLNVLDKFLLEC